MGTLRKLCICMALTGCMLVAGCCCPPPEKPFYGPGFNCFCQDFVCQSHERVVREARWEYEGLRLQICQGGDPAVCRAVAPRVQFRLTQLFDEALLGALSGEDRCAAIELREKYLELSRACFGYSQPCRPPMVFAQRQCVDYSGRCDEYRCDYGCNGRVSPVSCGWSTVFLSPGEKE